MPRLVPDNYFRTGPWRSTGPLSLRTYTCQECGHRSPTWAAFRAHRAHQPPCREQPERWGGRVTPVEALGASAARHGA